MKANFGTYFGVGSSLDLFRSGENVEFDWESRTSGILAASWESPYEFSRFRFP